MTALIGLIGVLLVLVALVVLVAPTSMRHTVKLFLNRKWMPAAVLVRLALGLVCILGADETRLPTLVSALGILVLLSGVAIPFLGFERIERLANFWLRQSNIFLRLWSLALLALGGILAWAGL